MGKINWHGNEVEIAVNKLLRRKLAQASLHTVGEIKKVITEKRIVDTGLLRSSISFTMDDGTTGGDVVSGTEYPEKPKTDLTAHIGTTVFYAPYHEFGFTLKPWGREEGMRSFLARPYIRPGFERAKKKINEIFATKEKL